MLPNSRQGAAGLTLIQLSCKLVHSTLINTIGVIFYTHSSHHGWEFGKVARLRWHLSIMKLDQELWKILLLILTTEPCVGAAKDNFVHTLPSDASSKGIN